jgi:hypothetical protein
MADSEERQKRLEELQAAAEAQMRRPAPALVAGDDAPPAAKRARAGGAPPASAAAAKQEGEEDAAAAGVAKRFNYAAPDALLGGGAQCLIVTCPISRQMSATKTGLELITRHLPAGCSASLVKVGCSGVVLVLVQSKAGQEQPQQSGEDGAKVAERSAPQEAAAAPGGDDATNATSSSSGGGGGGGGKLDMVEVAAAALAEVESGRVPRLRCGLALPTNAA